MKFIHLTGPNGQGVSFNVDSIEAIAGVTQEVGALRDAKSYITTAGSAHYVKETLDEILEMIGHGRQPASAVS